MSGQFSIYSQVNEFEARVSCLQRQRDIPSRVAPRPRRVLIELCRRVLQGIRHFEILPVDLRHFGSWLVSLVTIRGQQGFFTLVAARPVPVMDAT